MSEEFQTSLKLHSSGSTVLGIKAERLIYLRKLLPPIEEQRQIASFLDRECGKMDALVEKQQKLITLLKEKRQAVITQAVTKGIVNSEVGSLNPHLSEKCEVGSEKCETPASNFTPQTSNFKKVFTTHNSTLVPSNIQWLGDVPEGWKVGKLRYYADMKTGHTPSRSKPEYWKNCYIPWFTLADVWQLRSGLQKYLGETKSAISDLGLSNSAAELLPQNTVVLSRTASVGFSGIMPKPMATSQDFWNWVCGDKLSPDYLLKAFSAMKGYFDSLMMGSTHKTIYQADAASITISLPPLAEQRAIVAYLDSACGKIDTLISKAEQAIELLKERRTALISAAVTGKIDVRDLCETEEREKK